jgi:hypothetical protein
MAGLVPGIHVLAVKKVVDGRDKRGHDGRSKHYCFGAKRSSMLSHLS